MISFIDGDKTKKGNAMKRQSLIPRYIGLIFMFLLMALSICGGCQIVLNEHARSNQNAIVSPNIEELQKNIFFMQTETGGFSDVKEGFYFSTLTMPYIDTYYAVKAFSLLSLPYPADLLNDLQYSIRYINFDSLTQGNDAVTKIYCYIKINHILNKQIDPLLENSLIDYVANLQRNDGYYYDSRQAKEKSLSDQENINLSVVNDTLMALEILYDAGLCPDISSVLDDYEVKLRSLQSDYRKIDMDDLTVSAIKYLKLLALSKISMPVEVRTSLDMIYEYQMSRLLEGNISTMAELHNINVLQEFMDNNGQLHEETDSKNRLLLLASLEKFFNGHCYSVLSDQEFPHMLANLQALEIMQSLEITIEKEKKYSLREYILSGVNFDGSFSHSLCKPSSINASAYAGLIIAEVGYLPSDKPKIDKFISYLESEKENQIYDCNTLGMDGLLFLQACKHFGIVLPKERIHELLNNSFYDFFDYDTKNYDAFDLCSLLETARLYGISLGRENQSQLIEVVTANIGIIDSDSTLEQILLNCLNLNIVSYYSTSKRFSNILFETTNIFMPQYDNSQLSQYIIVALADTAKNFNIPSLELFGKSFIEVLLNDLRQTVYYGFSAYTSTTPMLLMDFTYKWLRVERFCQYS